MAKEWNASAERLTEPQPDDEGTSNLKSALLVVNAAWAAFADAFDRLPTATAFAPWSSTWTASPTARSSTSTSRRADSEFVGIIKPALG